ncbi:hypothetical protein HY478_03100 [Candidatus Uhrbacteria bacterium]|nr:hypothetical protein [Candidatus Uhrbacteria bacterium]
MSENAKLVGLLAMLLLFVFNSYLFTYYSEFDNWNRQHLGWSDARFSSLLLGLLFFAFAATLFVALITHKPANSALDLGLLVSLAAVVGNYIVFRGMATTHPTPGARLIVFSLAAGFFGSFLVLFKQSLLAGQKLFLLFWSQAILVASALLTAIPIGLVAFIARKVFGFDVSDYLFNPPIVGALLVLPVVLVSFVPSRHGVSLVPVGLRATLYLGYLVALLWVVPSTVHNTWIDKTEAETKTIFCGFIIISYAFFVWGAMELIRKDRVANDNATSVAIRDEVVPAAASLYVGLMIYMGALLTGAPGRVGGILVGHAFVGLWLGMLLPLWDRTYGNFVIPYLKRKLAIA